MAENKKQCIYQLVISLIIIITGIIFLTVLKGRDPTIRIGAGISLISIGGLLACEAGLVLYTKNY